jgi:hypothetical protein
MGAVAVLGEIWEIADGQHSGWYRWDQLHKTEKMHADTPGRDRAGPFLAPGWPRGARLQNRGRGHELQVRAPGGRLDLPVNPACEPVDAGRLVIAREARGAGELASGSHKEQEITRIRQPGRAVRSHKGSSEARAEDPHTGERLLFLYRCGCRALPARR